MALRDQPYLPLYVQDYLTDERLNLCAASTQGIYIKILCAFHKSENYGGILFKQNNKQNFSSIEYFVWVINRQIGFSTQEIKEAIEELIENSVLTIGQINDSDFLYQKRMVQDFNTSIKRSVAAKKGGGNPNLVKTKDNVDAKILFKQKDKQNTEYEYVNEYDIKNNKGGTGGKTKPSKKEIEIPGWEELKNYCFQNKPDIDLEWLRRKYDSYILDGWKDGNGNKITNWKSKMLNVISYGPEKKKENGIIKLTEREKLIAQITGK